MGSISTASLGQPNKTSLAAQVIMGKKLLALITPQTNPPTTLRLEDGQFCGQIEVVQTGKSLCVFIDIDPKVLS
ncbi:MAG: hypothetical protein WCT08_04970 [Patescibacteria group bacterium]|jgi:hypothetical protein